MRFIAVVAFGLTMALAAPTPAGAQVTVSTPYTVTGSYTVTWRPLLSGSSCRLEERSFDGPWVLLSTSCSSSRTFNKITPGDYAYRLTWSPLRPLYRLSSTAQVRVSTDLYDVGVLAAVCPDEMAPMEFFFDNEDDVLPDYPTYSAGWTGAASVDSNHNTRLKVCRVSGTQFKPLSASPAPGDYSDDYAVLKLGPQCPPGSQEFGRFVDNEDNDPISSVVGNVWPNSVDANGNTMLRFCLFRNAFGAGEYMADGLLPYMGLSYGVFASPLFTGSTSPQLGVIDMNDENDSSASYFDLGTITDGAAVKNLVDGNGLLGNTSTRTKFFLRESY